MAFNNRIVHVVNRGDTIREVTDDGVPWQIPCSYKQVPTGENDESGNPIMEVIGAGPGNTVLQTPLPFFAAERAKRQNPVMGTEDPYNVNSFVSWIAVPEWGEDYEYLEERPGGEAIERIDREQLPEEFQRVTIQAARGGRKKIQARDPKTGRMVKRDPNARSMVQGEARENLTGMDLRS